MTPLAECGGTVLGGDDDGRWSGDGAGHDVLVLHLSGSPAGLAVRRMADAMRPAGARQLCRYTIYFEGCYGSWPAGQERSLEAVSVQVSGD